MISVIPTFKLQACLKYHAASARRKELFSNAYAGKYSALSTDEIAEILLESMSVGTTTGIYCMNHQVIGVAQ